jgi:hypothetical protein
MEIVHTHCAGLDVHKKTVVAAISVPGPKRSGYQETRTFGTMTAALLALSDWLTAHGVTHVAMESRGSTGNLSSTCWRVTSTCSWLMPPTSRPSRVARQM